MKDKAIGVFDSGIGGLTVYQAIKEKMTQEKVIYLGDTARLPYGTKSPEAIIHFSLENAQFLLKQSVKLIVVACNSSTSYALQHLQDSLDIPVIGVIEPGCEAAVKASQHYIGVIGTAATIMSRAYEKAILKRKPEAKILSRECPLFVPLVEEGWIDHPITRMVIAEYLLPLKKAGIDTLVLGCTHYPVLKAVIAEVLGKDITLIDSAKTTANQVFVTLTSLGWLNSGQEGGEDEFYVTDFPERFQKVATLFLKRTLEKVTAIPIKICLNGGEFPSLLRK